MSNDDGPGRPSYPPRIRKLLLQRSDNSSHSPPPASSIPVQYEADAASIPVGIANREGELTSSMHGDTDDDDNSNSNANDNGERPLRHPVRENSLPEIDTLSPPPSRAAKLDSGRHLDSPRPRDSREGSGFSSDREAQAEKGGRKGKGKGKEPVRYHPYMYAHGASRGVQFPRSAERDYSRESAGPPYTESSSSTSRRSPTAYVESDSEPPSSPRQSLPPPHRRAPSTTLGDSDEDDPDKSEIDELDSDSDEDLPIPPSALGGEGSGRSGQQQATGTWRYGEAQGVTTTSGRSRRRQPSCERYTPPEDRIPPRPPAASYGYAAESSSSASRRHGASSSSRASPPPWSRYDAAGPSTSRRHDEEIAHARPSFAQPYQPIQVHPNDPSARRYRYDHHHDDHPRRPIDGRPAEQSGNPHWQPYLSPGRSQFALSPAKFDNVPTRSTSHHQQPLPPPPPHPAAQPTHRPYYPPPPLEQAMHQHHTMPPMLPQQAQPMPPNRPMRMIMNQQITIPERGTDVSPPYVSAPQPRAPAPPRPLGLKFIIPPHSILTRRSPPPPSLPSDIETEAVLRNVTGLPVPMALNLTSLRDATHRRELPKLSMLMALAIWGSPGHMLTLSGIITAIEERFPFMATDDSWKRTIRHKLSFVSAFVRAGKHNEGWMLDVRKSFAGRGAKRLAELRAAARM